jgi:hypothetical protein
MRAARLLPLLLFALVLAACGKSKNVVLLLPDPDGHVGRGRVQSQGSQTGQAGTATRIAQRPRPARPHRP